MAESFDPHPYDRHVGRYEWRLPRLRRAAARARDRCGHARLERVAADAGVVRQVIGLGDVDGGLPAVAPNRAVGAPAAP